MLRGILLTLGSSLAARHLAWPRSTGCWSTSSTAGGDESRLLGQLLGAATNAVVRYAAD